MATNISENYQKLADAQRSYPCKVISFKPVSKTPVLLDPPIKTSFSYQKPLLINLNRLTVLQRVQLDQLHKAIKRMEALSNKYESLNKVTQEDALIYLYLSGLSIIECAEVFCQGSGYSKDLIQEVQSIALQYKLAYEALSASLGEKRLIKII